MGCADTVLFQSKTKHPVLTRPISSPQNPFSAYPESWSPGKEEHRYHEALVHPAMSLAFQQRGMRAPKRVLLLGAGDGLAARELLMHDDDERTMHIDLVDIDDKITTLCGSREHGVPDLLELTRGSLSDPRVSDLPCNC